MLKQPLKETPVASTFFLIAACGPFVGLLLSMAVCTTFFPKFWERALGQVALFWALPSLVFMLWQKGLIDATHTVFHLAFLDYMPFLFLLATLYVVAGGIKLRIHVHATPLANVLVMAGFTLLAGVFGTTGAAMLGIHPLMVMNHHRHYQTHTVLCFIFLVCNIGGGLSSVGDPPLFLGFLKGVSFLWPTLHLWAPVLLLTGLLLLGYFVVDHFYFHKEPLKVQEGPKRPRIQIEGKKQLLLIMVTLAVLVVPALLDVKHTCGALVLELMKASLLMVVMWLSFRITSMTWRKQHRWTFHPLTEVAMLFAALFITAHPLIELLSQGDQGPFASLIALLCQNNQMAPVPTFWVTGLLSAFLDNAPTYLIFFQATQLSPEALMTTAAPLLKAISLGAVFMGALTYIGNAPNLLVKAIAEEEYRVKMPNFLQYIGISFLILLPLLALITLLL